MNLRDIELVPKSGKFQIRYMSKVTGSYKYTSTTAKSFKGILAEKHQDLHRLKHSVGELETELQLANRQIEKLIDDADLVEFLYSAQNARNNTEHYLHRQTPRLKEVQSDYNFYMDQIDEDDGEYITLMLANEDKWYYA